MFLFHEIVDQIMDDQFKTLKPYTKVPVTECSVWPTEASAKVNEVVYGKCLRAVWYRLMGFPQLPLDIHITRVFELGKKMEEIERAFLKEFQILNESSLKFVGVNPIEENQKISGEIDFIVKFPDGKNYIIEYKTSAGYAFTTNIIEKGGYNIEHLFQIALYLYFYDGSDIGGGQIAYNCRTFWERNSVPINIDKDGNIYARGRMTHININMIFRRFKEVYLLWYNKILPARDYIPMYDNTMSDELKVALKNHTVSKNKFERWRKGKDIVLSDWHCSYCKYRLFCILNRENRDEKITSADINSAIANIGGKCS